jgi:hypothetical protein
MRNSAAMVHGLLRSTSENPNDSPCAGLNIGKLPRNYCLNGMELPGFAY